MPAETYGEAGASSGPMGSVPFGQGQELEKTQQAGNQAARQQPAQAAPPGAAPPGAGAPPQAGGAPPAPDAQPQPQPPFHYDPKDFPLTTRAPMPVPWREQLAMWANHPQANEALRKLALLAGRGRSTQ